MEEEAATRLCLGHAQVLTHSQTVQSLSRPSSLVRATAVSPFDSRGPSPHSCWPLSPFQALQLLRSREKALTTPTLQPASSQTANLTSQPLARAPPGASPCGQNRSQFLSLGCSLCLTGLRLLLTLPLVPPPGRLPLPPGGGCTCCSSLRLSFRSAGSRSSIRPLFKSDLFWTSFAGLSDEINALGTGSGALWPSCSQHKGQLYLCVWGMIDTRPSQLSPDRQLCLRLDGS